VTIPAHGTYKFARQMLLDSNANSKDVLILGYEDGRFKIPTGNWWVLRAKVIPVAADNLAVWL